MNKNKELTALVLASNETFSLEEVIEKLISFSFLNKIIIVSPSFVSSNCLETQKNLSKKYSNIKCLIQPEQFPGYGGAVKYGLSYVDTPYFCWLDGDGETDPAYLEDMYKILIENKTLNIVNASRFKKNNMIIEGYGFISSILTYFFQVLCKIFFTNKITDYTVGYRLYRTEFFKKFDYSSNDQNFSLETLLLPLLSNETKVSEVYYKWIKRSDGKSRNNILNKFTYFKVFFKILYIKIFKKI